ncbi:GntR family transcriptional regulator [Pedococcus bigeumensis]|uniref:GntR family transcriptional regulator n=1 Tax=Pedococcus bigeumensis TaxID=433644 RepID=UPI002FED9088
MTTTSAPQQAYERLAHDLEVGQYAPGGRLPGERQLAASLGVSRATLRLALSRLEQEGVLSRSAQRGWFVPRQVLGEPPSTLQSFTEMARARGLRPTTQVLRQELRPATMDEAAKLRIAPAAPVIEIDRLRGMDGTPVCFDVVVLAQHRAGALADADLNDASLYEQLRERCGLEVHRSAYTLMADLADAEVAALLGTRVGAAVLIGDEVGYAADGTPVLVGRNTYRGDAYRFEADLYRRA